LLNQRRAWGCAQAKKISEIHAAAQAELGMVVPGLLPAMASLPALPRGLAPGQAQDVDLFPAFKGGGVHARFCWCCAWPLLLASTPKVVVGTSAACPLRFIQFSTLL